MGEKAAVETERGRFASGEDNGADVTLEAENRMGK
jgi:hypothetical protein